MAGVTIQRIGTEIASVVEQSWRPRFGLEANEERIVSRGFDGADGVTKFGNTLNISKISVLNAVSLATSVADVSMTGLTFETQTELNITVSALDYYSAVALGRNSMNRMLRSTELQAGYKTQLQKTLVAGIDVQAGALVPSLSTNIVGSGAVPISKSLLLSALSKLSNSAKEMFVLGKTTCYLTVHGLRTADLLNIPDITAANVRGDTVNPNVTGRVWTAWGMDVGESGNVSTSGGAAHNLLHIRESHVLAYNEEPNVLDPQTNGLATLLIGYTNFGVGEVFDEWAVDIQSSST